MQDNPLVSIITPCYNSQRWVSRFLDSIISQTYNHIELIVINDGSQDNTKDVVLSRKDELKQSGVRLRYHKQINQGLGGAINAGLKLVGGEYFTWCDSDNFYTNDYIKTKVDFFSIHPEFDIVRCDGYIVNDGELDKPLSLMSAGEKNKFNQKLFLNALETKDFHFGCAMLKTKAFDRINPKREIYPSREGQNWQLLLPMFYHYKSGYIDKPMFYFVYRKDSISNAAFQKDLGDRIAQIDEYQKIIITTLDSMDIENAERRKYMDIVTRKYAKKKMRLAKKYGDSKLLEDQYFLLLENGWASLSDKMLYLSDNSMYVGFAYKAAKLFAGLLKKVGAR